MSYVFAHLDEKNKLLGNCEKSLKLFDEISIEILNFHFLIFKF